MKLCIYLFTSVQKNAPPFYSIQKRYPCFELNLECYENGVSANLKNREYINYDRKRIKQKMGHSERIEEALKKVSRNDKLSIVYGKQDLHSFMNQSRPEGLSDQEVLVQD